MANKKITDFPLRSTFDNTCMVPIDDGTQSFKVTADQLSPGLRVRKVVRTRMSGSGNFTVPEAVSVLNLLISDQPAFFADAMGIDISGNAWSWGYNSTGKLGDGTTAHKSSPVAVIGGRKFVGVWKSENVNYFDERTAWLQSDGALYCAGTNANGGIGDATVTDRSSPVAVIGGHRFKGAAVGSAMTVALKTDGTAWAWGYNTAGNLGDGTIAPKSSPVAVIGGHSFIDVKAGEGILALKADGTAWACGYNIAGQLGDGTILPKSSPIAVIGGHSFIRIAAAWGRSYGLKANGQLWAWGDNTSGGLGDGTILPKSSPIQVIGGHSFTAVSSKFDHVLALKADGTVWSWGNNASGQLGHGTITLRSSPVQVIGSVSFSRLQAGTAKSFGLNSSGVDYGWGLNSAGDVGDGTIVNRSSPVAVIGGHTFIGVGINQTVYVLPVTAGDVIAYTPTSFGGVTFSPVSQVFLEYMGLDT